jgi:16S rRNA (guanine966-N2)-methyltransferase
VLRIVAGSARGRRLAAPDRRRTRPTADRVREALFSTLHSLLGPMTGTRFADLYAGSGAVGLEALSRGRRTRFSWSPTRARSGSCAPT